MPAEGYDNWGVPSLGGEYYGPWPAGPGFPGGLCTVSNTQTALALAIQIRRGTSTAITVAYDQLDRFVTPGTFYVPYVPPTGFLVLPPGSAIVGICAQLGFDAAVPLTVVAELGILG